MVEHRHLHYFTAVGEELNFSRAADRLHMAQPPLSVAIRKLERELGTELLTRTTREVRLTEAGATFLAGARRVLKELEHTVQATRRAAAGELGSRRIAFSSATRYETLPLLGRALRATHPHVELAPLQPQMCWLEPRRSRSPALRARASCERGHRRVADVKQPYGSDTTCRQLQHRSAGNPSRQIQSRAPGPRWPRGQGRSLAILSLASHAGVRGQIVAIDHRRQRHLLLPRHGHLGPADERGATRGTEAVPQLTRARLCVRGRQPRWPRNSGLVGGTTGDLLSKFAGPPIGLAAAKRACPDS